MSTKVKCIEFCYGPKYDVDLERALVATIEHDSGNLYYGRCFEPAMLLEGFSITASQFRQVFNGAQVKTVWITEDTLKQIKSGMHPRWERG